MGVIMNRREWLWVVVTSISCLVVVVILVPIAVSLIHWQSNFWIPFQIQFFISALLLIGIIAYHSRSLLKANEVKPASRDSIKVVQDLTEQLKEIKGE